jgi:nucleolar protein 14
MGFGEEEHLGMTLTHGGRSIDDLKGDDFAAQGLGDDDDDELEDDFGLENTRRRAEPSGLIDRSTVKRSHFGGFEGDGDDEEPDRKKSKAEVMAEVIAKSKTHKVSHLVRPIPAPFA